MEYKQSDFLEQLFAHEPEIVKVIRTRQFSAKNLARYPGLSDIPPDEWDEFFPNTRKPWDKQDLYYLVTWWGKDDVISLSYALGRTPWRIYQMIGRLKKQGVELPQIRKRKSTTSIRE